MSGGFNDGMPPNMGHMGGNGGAHHYPQGAQYGGHGSHGGHYPGSNYGSPHRHDGGPQRHHGGGGPGPVYPGMHPDF